MTVSRRCVPLTVAPATPDGGFPALGQIDSRVVREIAAFVRAFCYATTAFANARGEWPKVRLNAAPNALSDS